jgi:peroxiredoxin
VGKSKAQVFTIDKLAPKIGPAAWYQGPFLVPQDLTGRLMTVAGTKLTGVVSTIGGATEVQLIASISGKLTYQTQMASGSAGLWRVELEPQVGEYDLLVKSLDGAGRTDERSLGTLLVKPAGVVTGNQDILPGVKIEVWQVEPQSQQLKRWDGESYSQVSPLITDQEGKYQLLLPQGKYALKFSHPDYVTATTSMFTLSQAQAINMSISLTPRPNILGKMWRWWWPEINAGEGVIPASAQGYGEAKGVIKGTAETPTPLFSLVNDQETVYSTAFRGKPTVLLLVSPALFEADKYLKILDTFSMQNNLRILGVMVQKNVTETALTKAHLELSMNLYADINGDVTKQLSVTRMPTTLLLDGSGREQYRIEGEVTTKQLTDLINRMRR